MKTRIFIFLFLINSSLIVFGQNSVPDSLDLSFFNQLLIFPQEKIYLHTDKPYYIPGERIWFRAHLADAATHYPVSFSRYVYVELINPLDSIVTRVKIREEEGAYHGNLSIPVDAPEGDYTIRAYTTFMRSQEEHYFFTQTVHIGDPQSLVINTDTRFIFEPGNDGKIHATFRFSNMGTDEPLVPKSVKVSVNDGQMMRIDAGSDGIASFNFTPSNSPKGRLSGAGDVILLEAVVFNYPYRKFIRVPTPDNDFDVSFYPEGGSLLQGTSCIVGFKAMKSDGQAAHISGVVYDRGGNEIQSFESEHPGLGRFMLHARKGETYYAICQNDKGQSKRFELPASIDYGYALTATLCENNIVVSMLKPAEYTQSDDLYLLAHTRGIVHFVDLLSHNNPRVVLPTELFPSGVVQLMLFNSDLNPVSERLFFINHQDQAQVTYQPDPENFTHRSLIKNSVMLRGSDGEPLTGNFSVSVTSDSEVTPDSTSSILTQLLLTSDLRGHIENPAYYFQNKRTSAYMLDLLMLTQGWRRYDMAGLAQGRYSGPAMPVEIGPTISGTVKNMDFGRPVANAEVTAVSITKGFIHSVQTDRQGRFDLPVNEFPEGTTLVVSAENRGLLRLELTLDKETFPKRTLPPAITSGIDRRIMAKYTDKAELQFVAENGERVYDLPEVTITARQVLPSRSALYTRGSVSATVTDEVLEKFVAGDIYGVIKNQLPSIQLAYNDEPPPRYHISLSPRGLPDPLILINETPVDISVLDMLNVSDIEQIDIIRSTSVYGDRSYGGVISIYMKIGSGSGKRADIPQEHIKYVLPLGYQQPVEFYAPKYDTPEKRNAQTPDLRTTIHWQPVVQTDSTGAASFEFYTAGEQSSYTVVIEGLSDDGKIIKKEGKLFVNQ